MVELCPECGLRFEQDEGSRLGSAMVNYAVVAFATVAYIVAALIMTVPDVPVWPIVAGAACLIIVVAVLVFPFGKTIWIALEYVLKGYELP
jgi:uncharacterized protein (DUF983 family)